MYKSANGLIDTLEVKDTVNNYTPCNKFELSSYQFEVYAVGFKLKSKNGYNNDEPSITMTTENMETKDTIYLFR